jgi:WD40 repeat protein
MKFILTLKIAVCLIIIAGTLACISNLSNSQNIPNYHAKNKMTEVKSLQCASSSDVNSRNQEKHLVSRIFDKTKIDRTSAKQLQLADPLFGTVYKNLSEHRNSVRSVTYSPDARIVASGSADETIRLWNATSGQELSQSPLTGHSGLVYSVAFSLDGTILASGSGDRIIKLWNITSGELLYDLINHSFGVSSVAFSPSGTLLASGGADGNVKIWDIGSRMEFLVPDIKHDYGETSVAFSPNGKILVTSGSDRIIKLWNTTDWKELSQSPLINHSGAVRSVDFSPDGNMLVSGSADGTIRLWDVAKGSQQQVFEDHTGIVYSVDFSPDGKLLASGSSGDGDTKLWDVSSSQLLQNLTGHESRVFSIAFSPDGTMLASGSLDTTVLLWNLIRAVEPIYLAGHAQSVNSIAYSPDGTMIASGSRDATIKIWNLTNGAEILNLTEHTGPITSVAWSPNGNVLASGGADEYIRLWNASNGIGILSPILAHANGVSSISFSPDGTILASAGGDWAIKLWNLSSGIELPRSPLTGHVLGIYSVSFSTDGKTLASGSADGTIKLWNVSSGMELPQPLSPLIGHDSPVTSVIFSLDAMILISGSYDRTIRLWNLSNGVELPQSPFLGHTHYVTSVAFSPEYGLVTSGSYDRTIRLWNITNGKTLQILPDSDLVNSIRFSPNGTVLACSSRSTNITLWKTIPIPLDIDGDGMNDNWERLYGLEPTYFWDKFEDLDNDKLTNSMEFFLVTNTSNSDSDGDLMPDGWEYLAGLNPALYDAISDSDGDGMTNYYEFIVGLNTRVDDGTFDKDLDGLTNLQEFLFGSRADRSDSDLDGMSDLHEYIYGFNATDPDDAAIDSDGDWIANIDEIRGGSNPRNFLSVPLVSFSALHVTGGLIAAIISVMGVVSYKRRREKQRRELVSHLKAPDYLTTLKIKAAGAEDYQAYKQMDIDAKTLLEEGWTCYLDGNHSAALQQLDKALELFERIDYDKFIAETVFRIAKIEKEMEILTAGSTVLDRFPRPPYEDGHIQVFKCMLKALLEEVEMNWGIAAKEWQKALSFDDLDETIQQLCQNSLEELEQRPITPVNLENLKIGLCLGSFTDTGLIVYGKSKNCSLDDLQLRSMLEYSAVLFQHGEIESFYGPFPQKTTKKSTTIEYHFLSFNFRIKDNSVKDPRVIKQGGMVPAIMLLIYRKEYEPAVKVKETPLENYLKTIIMGMSDISKFTRDQLIILEEQLMKIITPNS